MRTTQEAPIVVPSTSITVPLKKSRINRRGGHNGGGESYPPSLCISFAYRARSEIFASISSFLISSHLARSARSGGFHSPLCRRSGTSLIYCFNTERGVLLSFGMPPSHRAIVVDTFSVYCLLCAKRCSNPLYLELRHWPAVQLLSLHVHLNNLSHVWLSDPQGDE